MGTECLLPAMLCVPIVVALIVEPLLVVPKLFVHFLEIPVIDFLSYVLHMLGHVNAPQARTSKRPTQK